ncbi:MAG: TIR domain-containing protein [Anaerolineales bacterium]
MAKKKVFISYDYDNDKTYKNLLLAWDANDDFDFGFYDMSIDVSVDSSDAAAIKRVISARINLSPRFLCLIGKKTHKSKWIDWEIKKAIELKKKLVAVKINKVNTAPAAILNQGALWALSFTFDGIKKAIDSA